MATCFLQKGTMSSIVQDVGMKVTLEPTVEGAFFEVLMR
jgi:hypothetical protein